MSNDSLRIVKLRGLLATFREQLRRVSYPVAISFCTTAITFAFGACAVLVFEKAIPGESWLAIWKRWDALPFLDLAQNGYPHEPGSREHVVALLPVYPLAIRAGHLFIADWHLAAVVISNCCCAAALVYLFLLAHMEYDAALARGTVLFCAIFPTAYFLHIAYSESIFLLLTVAAFYYARRGQWLVCGLLGMFATGTRIPGVAVLPPLALEYLQQRNFRWRGITASMGFLLLIPLGAVAYLLINYYCFHDPLHFLATQKQSWGVFLRWPVQSVTANWYGIRHFSADERVVQYGGPLAAFIFSTAALLAAPFVLRPCYSLYLAISWVIIFFNNFTISSPRYILVLFPIFILLARLTRSEWLRDSIAFLFALFYAICAMHFARGWWAF
jgi:Mannosyltransferase (PIG-V)